MFHKPFRIKQSSLLKGSERKKIRTEILKSFPQLEESELMDLIPQKEEMSFTKLISHSGEAITVYSVEKLPIVFVLESVVYPTVYTLWKCPNMLPVFTTWPQVLSKLSSGADLMLPGVVLKETVNLHSYGKLEKGTSVAVNLTSNKAPIAVGVTALSSFDMYMAAKRGKAVKIHHIVGDHLYSLGATVTIPELGPPDGFQEEEEPVTKTDIEPGACDTQALCEQLQDVNVEGDTPQTSATVDDIKNEMDELLLYCFLKSWKTSAKNVEFPVLSSNFYRLHMLPACPMDKTVDIKKSSYKKLSKLLSAMEELGVVKLKELTKGVESIISVDYEHSMLRDFVDTNLMPKASDREVKEIKPEITEMRTVTAAVLPVLSCFGHKKGDSLSPVDVRKSVTDYVKTHNLQSTSDKSEVTLDSVLKTVLQCPNTDSLKWGDLMATFLGRMSHSYQISIAGESTITAKGKLNTIDIQVAKRAGNKKVTLVNNLEVYKINLQEFARECQHGAAASTSINTIAGAKSKQLLIQGNQVLFVVNLLTEKYNIPMRYIRGLEYAPKSKK